MKELRAVAITTHSLVTGASGLFWFLASRFRVTELREFGDALPSVTQLLYDFELPGLVFGALLISLITAALLRSTKGALVLSVVAISLGALMIAWCWWAMHLPL